MNNAHIIRMIDALQYELLQRRTPDGKWRGHLSSSAISTSASLFALHMIDKAQYTSHIDKGVQWLLQSMHKDGSWGDSLESPSNMTATLLSYTALFAIGAAPRQTREYLAQKFGGYSDQHIIKGVLQYYGKDLTFSVPILVMCALSGIIQEWDDIPQLPFEVSVLPQGVFRFFNLPVVSYAIPALIAVGILRFKKGKKNILAPLRQSFVKPALNVLTRLQPEDGGFLEAAPLTAFVSMCMAAAGYTTHMVTKKAAAFLTDNVREDGSWPIDTDLSCWVTTLSVRAIDAKLIAGAPLATQLQQQAFTYKHPFTGAAPGGWGWTDLSGSVPDADDTSGALVALHKLTSGIHCAEADNGVRWLLWLQNKDGGMPTFCKGWGKLPFDRSSPDISAHALLAFDRWMKVLPEDLKHRCQKSSRRMLHWMEQHQAADGSWTPLWFGDQDTPSGQAPVYGTATAVDYLAALTDPKARAIVHKGVSYILSTQNPDGGWGGAAGIASKVTYTARAIGALAAASAQGAFSPATAQDSLAQKAVERGFDFLYEKFQSGTLLQAEPIGLYFAKLWYSEELYNITFTLNALHKLQVSIQELPQ